VVPDGQTDLITEGPRPTLVVRIRPADWPEVHMPREEYLDSGNFRHEDRFPTPAIPKYMPPRSWFFVAQQDAKNPAGISTRGMI
jgi:hypothetical protein